MKFKYIHKPQGGGLAKQIDASFGLPEVNVYPQNEFGDIARNQGINRARNWRKVKEGTTKGINDFYNDPRTLMVMAGLPLPSMLDAAGDAIKIVGPVIKNSKVGLLIGNALGKNKQSFKSLINWGRWNKEIPKNKLLLNEYNNIERATKESGTWMKNSDGSSFKGFPEQFIQLRSKNFKNYYDKSLIKGDNGDVLFMYHGSPNKNITLFLTPKDANYIKNPSTTTGEGGIYFSNKKDYADLYLDFGSEIPKKIGRTYLAYISPRTRVIAGDNILDDLNGSFLWNHEPLPVDAVSAGKYLRKKYPDVDLEVAIHNPNVIKSATGNNGMFDMTNPNIYKTIIGGAAIQQLNKNKDKNK